jgi:hypothetical protein
MGHPTVYPTGVTVYDPGKAWNGYTIFPAADLGALLIDMNGSEVQLWRGLQGFPNKLLPNGQVFGSTGLRATQRMVSGSNRSGSGRLGRQYRLAVQPP